MTKVLEDVTRVAIAEILQNNTTKSKFGYIISNEKFSDLVDEIYTFLETNRNLRQAGNKFLTQAFQSETTAKKN